MDIKIDFHQTINEFNSLTKYLKENTKQSNKAGKGFKDFPSQSNRGVQWSERSVSGDKAQSNPFIKIYHKEIELDNNSFKFASKYLNPDEYKNLIRLETTIKNKNHFKYLGIKDNNLSTILNLSQEQLKKVFKTALKKHLINNKPLVMKHKEKPTPEELLKIATLNTFADNLGYDVYMSAKHLTQSIECKTTRYRKKQQYIKLYDKYIKGNTKDIGTNTSKILRFIGWM